MHLQINGSSYDRWEDVPEDLRRTLLAVMPDRDGDGIPDSLQERSTPGRIVRNVTKVRINGVEYDSPDQMPAEARQALRAAGLPRQQPVQSPAARPEVQSELTRQLLGEAPPRKWWQFWRR